ncbi:MAG: ABC transporter permease [Eubacterium sp.]|nr:ABC transporter permease [Eubacterium sp.]
MFKNFGNVFKFSFKNAVTRGYKILTVIMAIILVAVPILIMVISAGKQDDGKDEIDPCLADTIYVVNRIAQNEMDFNSLNVFKETNYDSINYINCESEEEALDKLKATDDAAFILGLEIKNDTPSAYIIVPDGRLSESKARNYYDFMEKYQNYFMVLAAGLDEEGLRQVMTQSEVNTYHETGYKEGVSIEESEENDDVMAANVLKTFKSLLPYICLMLLYFLILSYGASISQSIVMEKSSKLMDTMLVSVRPEALCLGKFLAVVAAAVTQILIWIAAAVGGFMIGNVICENMFPNANFALLAFFKMAGSLGVFKIGNVIIAILILVVGFLLFASLAVVAGAISRSREEAASASSIFIIPLILAFFAIMFGGGLESGGAPEWMLYVPFTAALITPAYVSLGVLSLAEGLVSFGIMLICALLFVIAAGRLYKMMSLYKGNQVKMSKVLKMLFTGESALAQKK